MSPTLAPTLPTYQQGQTAIAPPANMNSTAAGTPPNSVAAPNGAGFVPATTYGANPPTATTAAPIVPQSEDSIYSSYLTQGQSIIDQINKSAEGQIDAANQNIDQSAAKAQQDQNAVASITGNFGSASAAGANAVSKNATAQKNTQDSAIQEQATQAVTSYMGQLQSAAQAQANTEQSEAPGYNAALQQAASATIGGLIKLNPSLTLDQLQSSNNPQVQQTYQNLLQAYGDDTGALAAAFAMAVPVSNVIQSYTQGSTYYQVVRNPQTNAVSVQSFDLGVQVPTGWTTTKVSTNTVLQQDPNNPGNSLIITTDPLTGNVSVTGSGTGSALAADYNSNQNTSPTTSALPAPTDTTGESYIQAATSTAGVEDPTTLFSDATDQSGIGSLVTGVIKAEGGSLPGVNNNPGNVKYVAGMPGATDSGVAAADGGTFASFATPEAGQQAIASTLSTIAQNQGSDATVQSVLSKYANLGSGTAANGSSITSGSNGLSTQQYGLLANVPGFDPGPTSGTKTNAQAVDNAAYQYLQTYLKTGVVPSNTNVLGMRSGTSAELPTIAQRAEDLYTQATGQSLPNQDTLNSNLALVANNNSLLNNLNVQTGTIQKNFGLNLENLTENNINKAPPIVNGITDWLAQQAGSTSVAQYLNQNQTLTNELGSLLAIKNASGTTVADKLSAAELNPTELTVDQQKQIINTLMAEAKNQQQSIGAANAQLYQQVDPLGNNPQNPVNQPGYQELVTGAGFTDNYDGTYSAPDGSVWSVDAQGNVTQEQ